MFIEIHVRIFNFVANYKNEDTKLRLYGLRYLGFLRPIRRRGALPLRYESDE